MPKSCREGQHHCDESRCRLRLPTQFFAEWAKDHGYDGIRYGSAMAEGGHNVVLFDTAAVAIRSARLVRTDTVEVAYSDYEGEED